MSVRVCISCRICGEAEFLESCGTKREAAKSLRWALKESGWKDLDHDPICPACSAAQRSAS